MFKQFFLVVSTLFLGSAFAHSGHDHSAWHSGLIHLVWIMPSIVLLAFVAIRFLAKKTNK